MDKIKARIITVAVMLMLGAISWMTLQNSINAFRIIEAFFGAYGFIRFGTDLYTWMQIPARVAEQNHGKRVRTDA